MNLLIKELGVASANGPGSDTLVPKTLINKRVKNDVCLCQKQISILVKKAQGSKVMR
jgi:hypothetical protein